MAQAALIYRNFINRNLYKQNSFPNQAMATKPAAAKIRKKKWYPIVAPSVFRNVQIGETLVFEEGSVKGKTITENLMNLTGNIKNQNINVSFAVTNVQDGVGHTEIVGYTMIPSSIRRLTRRRIDKIDLSFLCRTSDGKNLRLKPVIITLNNAKGAVKNRLRRTIQNNLIAAVSKLSYEAFVNELVSKKLQMNLRDSIKKIYPVRACEIRQVRIEEGKKAEEAAAKAVEAANRALKEEKPVSGKEAKEEQEDAQVQTQEAVSEE